MQSFGQKPLEHELQTDSSMMDISLDLDLVSEEKTETEIKKDGAMAKKGPKTKLTADDTA